jgi:uncharacterized protein
MTAEILPVQTPQGPGRLFLDPAPAQRSILVLGHGAGGGVTAADLELLARRLPASGITVLRFEQPWRTAGRRIAARTETLDAAWIAALGWIRNQSWGRDPLYAGGRSAGARVACRTALTVDARGVVCLAFPLHLPGRPEKSRGLELLMAGVPRLVLQGGNDAFGSAGEVRAAVGAAPGVRVVELPGADHGYRVGKAATFTTADLRALLLSEVLDFVGRE